MCKRASEDTGVACVKYFESIYSLKSSPEFILQMCCQEVMIFAQACPTMLCIFLVLIIYNISF